MAAFASGLAVCPVMIGRAAQLDAVRQRIDGVTSGRGPCVLITSEAGVGKSRLAAEAKRYAAAHGFVLVEGSCFPQDSACPYAPLLDLLRARFTAGALPIALLERFAQELAPLLPDLVPLPADPPPLLALDPAQQQRRLFEALVACLAAEPKAQPLLVIVEDLHWSDAGSLDFLLYLLRRSHAQPLLLIGTYRSDEVGLRLGGWLAQLEREQLAHELRLAALTRDEVAAMLRTIFALPRLVADHLRRRWPHRGCAGPPRSQRAHPRDGDRQAAGGGHGAYRRYLGDGRPGERRARERARQQEPGRGGRAAAAQQRHCGRCDPWAARRAA